MATLLDIRQFFQGLAKSKNVSVREEIVPVPAVWAMPSVGIFTHHLLVDSILQLECLDVLPHPVVLDTHGLQLLILGGKLVLEPHVVGLQSHGVEPLQF